MKLQNLWLPLLIALFLAFVCEVAVPLFEPRVFYLTKPIVCPSGTLEAKRYKIGAAQWEVVARCVKETTGPVVTFQADLVLFGMFFLGWFLLVALLLEVVRWWSRKKTLPDEEKN